jgi:N-acylneuraminate cytidylyltransferase
MPIETKTIVSTDDAEIARVAEEYGANRLPRESDLSDDNTDLLTLIRHDFPIILDLVPNVSVFACVLPTALLMSEHDLLRAIDLVSESPELFVVSIGRFSYPIQRALRRDSEGVISMIAPENYNLRSQDLEPRFHDAGQFYVGSPHSWAARRTMFDPPPKSQLIDDWRVCDIDVEEDWLIAGARWELGLHKP